VKNVIKFLRQNNFDGLDLDWEYPAYRDGSNPSDKENYAFLVKVQTETKIIKLERNTIKLIICNYSTVYRNCAMNSTENHQKLVDPGYFWQWQYQRVLSTSIKDTTCQNLISEQFYFTTIFSLTHVEFSREFSIYRFMTFFSNRHLDFINLLTYDYHSSYEPAVNHHSPLYPLEEDSEYNFEAKLNIVIHNIFQTKKLCPFAKKMCKLSNLRTVVCEI